MKRIRLTKGMSAMVDDADFKELSKWSWYALFNGRDYYAARGQRINGILRCILMHRQLADAKPRQLVDHKDRNSLNNQRQNFRYCSRRGNAANSKLRSDSSTGFKGVSFRNKYRTWRASIETKTGSKSVGGFKSPLEAARAYDRLAVKHFGEFALTNLALGLL